MHVAPFLARRVSRRGLLRMAGVVGLALPVLPLLAACGGDDDGPDASATPSPGSGTASPATAVAPAPTATTATPPTATSAPVDAKRGGTLRVALTG
ncbi:MAG: hypothetical protein DCC58_19660, partial [Chloroflexi bacterium]